MKTTPKWIEYGSRFWIAGIKYFDLKPVRGKIALGQQVRFIGNPSNIWDNRAIRVMFNGHQIGWVPMDSAIQHGMWSEHGAGSRIIGVVTSMMINVPFMLDRIMIQTLVLRKEQKKCLTKKQADVAFAKMKEELSYMVK